VASISLRSLLIAAVALALAAGSASAAVTVSPSSLSFGQQTVGTQGTPQQVTAKGYACGDPTPMVPNPCPGEEVNWKTDIAVSGPFVITSNNCPASLLAISISTPQCTISVAFLATATGTQNGFLRVQSSPSIVGVPLDGAGAAQKRKRCTKKHKKHSASAAKKKCKKRKK
jgi:hypothetical protein